MKVAFFIWTATMLKFSINSLWKNKLPLLIRIVVYKADGETIDHFLLHCWRECNCKLLDRIKETLLQIEIHVSYISFLFNWLRNNRVIGSRATKYVP